MRTPQSRSATLPRKVANSSVPDIIVAKLLLAPTQGAACMSFATIDRKCGFERELAGVGVLSRHSLRALPSFTLPLAGRVDASNASVGVGVRVYGDVIAQ